MNWNDFLRRNNRSWINCTLHGCMSWNKHYLILLKNNAVTLHMSIWVEIIQYKCLLLSWYIIPYVGAWIETGIGKWTGLTLVITPYEGVWVEIKRFIFHRLKTRITPYVGIYVGIWVETVKCFGKFRPYELLHPTWVYELKRKSPFVAAYLFYCTLRGCMSWNRWIISLSGFFLIASYAGVWIKTKHNLNICASPLLHPMWVYELKPAYTEKHSNYKADCTLRGCMSWNCDYWTDYPWCTLHPTWVYELKRGSRCSTSSLIAPYVGVWVEISVVIEYKQSSAYYALRGCVSWNVRLYQWKPYI